MDKSKLSVPVTFQKIGEKSTGDDRFTEVKCWLMHTEKNLNNSYFDKSVIEDAIPTLQYIPIVGFIELNEHDDKDFSDHRYVLTRTENGVEYKYAGNAYGVILSSGDNNAHFETKICDDGQEREFVVCNGVIWNQFSDSADIFMRDIEKSHSIELDENSIEGYEDEDGCFIFKSFSFKAACVLGGQAVPAMTGSNITVNFSMSDFISGIHSELNEKYANFAALVNDRSNQGGVKSMSNTDIEQVVEDKQEVVEETATAEVVEFEASESEGEVTEEVAEPEAKEADVEPEFADADAEVADVEANYEKVKADYEEMLSAFNQLKSDYESIKSEYDEMKPKYDEYVQAEEQRAKDELDAQKDAKFAEYEDVLSESAEFAALKEKKDEMSIDDIEKECAVMFVRASRAKMNFSKSASSSAVLGIISDEDDCGVAEGYVHTKYGNIKRGR